MKRKQDERGMLTVEAIMSLVPFILVIVGIISFINIFMVHNKIQYAMYEAANEIAGYCYFYEALGIRDGDLVLNQDADEYTEPLDTEIANMTNLLTDMSDLEGSVENVSNYDFSQIEQQVNDIQNGIENVQNSGNALWDSTMVLANDPMTLIQGIVYMGAQYADNAMKSFILQTFASMIIGNYLDSSDMLGGQSADTYLRTYGVVDGLAGLDYSDSKLFENGNNKIDIVVRYKINVYFFRLFKDDPTVEIVQRVTIPAWLDGDGEDGHYDRK